MISGDRALAEGKHGAFYNTLEEFHKYWERIDIITPRIKNNESRITNLFGNVFIHSSPWPLIFQSFWIFKKGQEIFRQNKFDLVTCHDYPPFYNGIGARLLWDKIKAPYLLELMHIPGHPKASGFKEWFYKQYAKIFVKFDAKKVKSVRVINHKQVPEFLARYGVPKDKLKYIPAFYIDLGIFKFLNLEKKYDLIFVGRLEKNKGIDILLDTAKKSDLEILIVGAGPMRQFIDNEIKDLKLDNIKCFGFAQDSAEIARLINESRVLVMPSYNEGGPRVILESLACGVPVIATRVGIVDDVVNKNNGRIIGWSALEVIEAFEEIKDMRVAADLREFERVTAIKNYVDKLKELI